MKEFASRIKQVEEYYFSTKLREVQQMISEGKPVINLGIGSPDLPPDPKVREALAQTALLEHTHGYQNYQGIPALREAMAKFYQKKYQVTLHPHQEILPLMGSKEGIFHLSMAFLNPGDQVLVPNPGYPTYQSVTRLLSAEAIPYTLDLTRKGRPNLETLEDMDLSKVKIMWINYPHMPTGAPGSYEILEELVDFAKKYQILLIHDNPYSHILHPKAYSILSIPGAKEVAMELNSLSKTFHLPGWRLGMLCGSAERIQGVLKVKSNMDSGMFLGLQHGAIAALSLDDNWFETQGIHYTRRRELVWKMAEGLGLRFDAATSGLFVWAKLPERVTSSDLVDRLLYEKNIFITPGSIFGTEGEGYVRISLCVSEDKLQEAIHRISDFTL
jgi:LL-diaminopimelate aminotransferase